MRVFIDANVLIYLNTPLTERETRLTEKSWLNLVKHHELYTNVLVLNETIYLYEEIQRISHGDHRADR